MAKGLTNQPLMIGVAPELFERPEILELMRQGHKVFKHDIGKYDLVIGTNCHYYDQTMADYLDDAVKAARARRREKK